MSLSLSSIVSGLGAAVTGVEAIGAAAKSTWDVVSQLVESAENVYSQTTGAGATKKAAVLAAAEAFANGVGADWSTLKDDVSKVIDAAKAAYNALA